MYGRATPRRDRLGSVARGPIYLDLVPVDSKLGTAGGAAPGKEARNLDHFCFRVDPFDEPSIRRHLEANGVEVGPVALRYGAEEKDLPFTSQTQRAMLSSSSGHRMLELPV
jgi:glyoxylase I family protein